MVSAPVGHHCPECVREDNRTVRQVRPAAGDALMVKVLIAVNVVVYLLQQSDSSIIRRFAMQPLAVADGQYYRMLTAAFLHASIMHILFNMLALWVVGPPLEAALGRVRFVALYIVAALGGSLCSYFIDDRFVFGVGASGAVFGLFGAYFIVARARNADSRQVLGLIVVNLVIGFAVPGIDNWAHIGGLVAGGALALAFVAAEGLERTARTTANVAAVGFALLLIAVLTETRTTQLTALAGLPFTL
jgi:membrane associated rhomboid family serine protease